MLVRAVVLRPDFFKRKRFTAVQVGWPLVDSVQLRNIEQS